MMLKKEENLLKLSWFLTKAKFNSIKLLILFHNYDNYIFNDHVLLNDFGLFQTLCFNCAKYQIKKVI